jgi:hypothetical protein
MTSSLDDPGRAGELIATPGANLAREQTDGDQNGHDHHKDQPGVHDHPGNGCE